MTTKTEQNHPGEAILSEANGCLSREIKTILSGESVVSGEVVAEILTAAAVAAAVAGNAGDGTCSAVVLTQGNDLGVYRIVFIEPGTNAGDFTVEDPSGVTIGTGVVGTEFDSGGLTFTISDGATDFAAGDSFTITVAEGSGKFVALDTAGTNGSEIAAGVMYAAVDASTADKTGVVIVRNAELMDGNLVWPTGISAGDQTTAKEQLAALGLIAR